MKSTAHSTILPPPLYPNLNGSKQHNAVEYSLIFAAGDLNLCFILSEILGK